VLIRGIARILLRGYKKEGPGTEVPPRASGAEPRWDLGALPQKARDSSRK